ncbi:hypothetical protein [Cohnella sp.]
MANNVSSMDTAAVSAGFVYGFITAQSLLPVYIRKYWWLQEKHCRK